MDRDEAYALVQQILAWAPGESYLVFLCALHLAGRLDARDEGVALLRQLVAREPLWLDYLQREAQVNHFGPDGDAARLLRVLNRRPH